MATAPKKPTAWSADELREVVELMEHLEENLAGGDITVRGKNFVITRKWSAADDDYLTTVVLR